MSAKRRRLDRLQAVWPPRVPPAPVPPADLSPLAPAERAEWHDLVTRYPPRSRANGQPDLSHYSDDEIERMYALRRKIAGLDR